MVDESVTGRELDVLRAVAQYTSSVRSVTSSDVQWLAERFSVSSQAICNYKRKLKDKGYLHPDLQNAQLTPKARRLLEDLQVVVPTQIPLVGKVMAGNVRHGDLVENTVEIAYVGGIEHLVDADFPTIVVPDVQATSLTLALQVIGVSMEYEHIYEGDFVIVRTFANGEQPRQGELIVTYYLPRSDEPLVDLEQASQWDVPEDCLSGPTLKYFYGKPGFYRLSWRKDTKVSDYTIETRYVKPIYRVVGVYQDRSS
jgi:SOS-response transcriptional repressor LexA